MNTNKLPLVRSSPPRHVELHSCPNCGHYMTPTKYERDASADFTRKPALRVELQCVQLSCCARVTVEGSIGELFDAVLVAVRDHGAEQDHAASELERAGRDLMRRAEEIRRGK